VSIRVNPDVDAKTHPYISTGLKKNKFGIPAAEALAVYREAAALPGIEVVGIDCHIGSQLTKTTPFTAAIERLGALVAQLQSEGIALRHVDIGGGLGISYGEEDERTPPSPGDYGAAIKRAMEQLSARGMTIVCEPGRVITGNAGLLMTRVLYLKKTEVKELAIVDAACNDLLRPALYGAYHQIQPVRRVGGAEVAVFDVVGPICESSDFLARDRKLARPAPGDLLAVMGAGAYGFVMASNYNGRPRAAEVLVREDRYAVVRARETLVDLVRGEVVPDFIS